MAKDYSKLNKDELLKVVESLESRKKYGLIWDEERTKEKFEQDAENAYPVLKEVKGRAINSDPEKPINLLIEGDNYHALSVLQYTHQGKIDVIYIDPPYNTGNRDFKYNDKWIDREDTYRHSKWLSFISKRIALSKSLLKDTGIIFISIDDNEQAQLKLLCDSIFGENNFLASVAWEKRFTRSNNAKLFATTKEFILVYRKSDQLVSLKDIRTERTDAIYTNPDNDPKGPWTSVSYVNPATKKQRPNLVYKIKNPFSGKMIEHETNAWKYAYETYLEHVKDKKLFWGPKGEHKYPRLKKYLSEVQGGITAVDLWGWEETGTTDEGTRELANMFHGKVFDNPKPIRLLKRILGIAAPAGKPSVVLDFFAGTGTTGHAVLEFNKEDKGNRQFILCTNNENGIASEVCFPRIEMAIKGYKDIKNNKVSGLGGNLRYFKTAFVKKSINRDEIKVRITNECTEMLCVREGIYNPVKESPKFRTFKQGKRMMGVYYALDRSGLSALKKELDKFTGEKVLYCFTLDPLGLDQKEFADWKDVRLEPIPQPILDIYQEIHELGT